MGFASVMRNIHFGFTHNKLMFASIVFLVRSIPCRVLLKKKPRHITPVRFEPKTFALLEQ